MFLHLLFILLGVAILTAGAEILIRGASSIGLRCGLSPLVVGLTIVAFGTSAPELAVAIYAAIQGAGDLVAGNVVGSNIFNVAVILGLSAIIQRISVKTQVIKWDMPVMLLASLGFAAFLYTGKEIARWEAAILFAALVAYTIIAIRKEQRAKSHAEFDDFAERNTRKGPLIIPILQLLVGIGGLVWGSNILVDHAVSLARLWNVSEAVIGLTIVAAGTSLPELATSIVAAIKKETDMAVGNIVGSNIFNMLSIPGIAGLAAPIAWGGMRPFDILFMLGLSLVLLPLMRTGFTIRRWEGILLLASYGVYLYFVWPV
ncbi:MAG: calcium/sodium antiporter [Verrucomicrobiota bacterium]